MFIDLELWVDGAWRSAARFEALGDAASGHRGKVALEYDADYARDALGAGGSRALSCRYLPSFELWIEEPRRRQHGRPRQVGLVRELEEAASR